MDLERCITGDWATARLRLSLCPGGRVLETRQGPGTGALREPASEVLHRMTAEWREAHGLVPVVLRGMAGSRKGWRESPYVPCPTDLSAPREGALRFEARGAPVVIGPGLSCQARPGSPQVMRAEETQIAGALALHPGLAPGGHRLRLPGPHTQWVWLEDGPVRLPDRAHGRPVRTADAGGGRRSRGKQRGHGRRRRLRSRAAFRRRPREGEPAARSTSPSGPGSSSTGAP